MRVCGLLTILLCTALAIPPYWTQITANGNLPRPLWDGASAYDKETKQWYIFGGLNGTNPIDFQIADFAVFDVATSTWTDLTAFQNGPAARAESMMWVNPKDGHVFVAGGRGRFRSGFDLTFSDTFAFDPVNLEWRKVSQTAAQERIANRSTEAVVATNKRPYVFSGSRSTLPAFINRPGAIQSNVASFKEQGWGGWKNITTGTETPRPTPRAHHPLAYSANRNSLFVYGGYTTDPNGGTFSEANYLGDFWSFDVEDETWSQIAFDVSQSPGKRDNAKLVVDDVNDRIWLYGGGSFTGETLSDLWYFSLCDNTWTQVNNVQGPFPPATIASYHFNRKQGSAYELFLFGGSLGELGGALTNDMWKLTIPFNA